MLTLLIYAPCEKVLIGEDQIASLISIMETVGVNVTAEIPADALAPIQWSVFSLWKRNEEVREPIEMEERTEVFRPDGTLATGGTTTFTVSNEHVFYRSLVRIPLFPIGLHGFVKVKCRTRRTNPETEWTEFAEFPLFVEHKPTQGQESPQTENETAAQQPEVA
ncbi:MAG: hypothetical protein WAM70_19550 [Pyrinomonadaceae bacterium]